MAPDLSGRAAVITGSTSGIGHAIAAALAAAGARIMLNGIESQDDGQAIADRLAKAYNTDIRYTRADLTEPDASVGVVEQTRDAFGGVDVLVNNAGIQHTAPVESFPPGTWDAIIAIMLSSPFHTIRTAVPMMKQQGWGRIINIASVHGRVASPYKSAYVSAKHGLVGLTRVVALENATVDITSNAICPGFVETPLIRPQVEEVAEREGITMDAAKVELVRHKQPSHRFVQPEQIGALAAFLCSDAASQITGTALSIDGGWTAQ